MRSLVGKLPAYILAVCIGIFIKDIYSQHAELFQDKQLKSIEASLVKQATFKQVLSKYEKVFCPHDALIIATFGQSNHSNFVKPKYSKEIPLTLYQYDWKNGGCYRYQEPLLGTQYVEGNVITPTVVKIANKISIPVIVVPLAQANTTIQDWAIGFMAGQHEYVMAHLKENNLSPDIFLWHQGEKDNVIYTKKKNKYHKARYFVPAKQADFPIDSSDEYEKFLDIIVSKTHSFFPNAQFGIALVSRCKDRLINESMRHAQQTIANKYERAFISADSDTVWGNNKRYDDCHFTQRGAEGLSEKYVKSITPFLKNLI